MSALVDHGQCQPGLPSHSIACADPREQLQCVVVTAHQDVLAVVDTLAGSGIGEGGGAAAKSGSCFKQQHLRAGLCQRRGCAESGHAAADDDDVRGHVRRNNLEASAEH